MKKFIKNLISVAIFLAGSYQTMCVVSLNSQGDTPKIEVRFTSPGASPAKVEPSTPTPAQVVSPAQPTLPVHRAVVVPVPDVGVPAHRGPGEMVFVQRAAEHYSVVPSAQQEAVPSGRLLEKAFRAVRTWK